MENTFKTEAVQKFEQRKASAPVGYYPARKAFGDKVHQNLDWSFLGNGNSARQSFEEVRPELRTHKKPRAPKISVTTATATVKHDRYLMTMTQLDLGNYLTTPSPRAKSNKHSYR